MLKKFGKVLFGTALIGAVIGCGLAYLNKCKKEEAWDDDFHDFDDDFKETPENLNSSMERDYVTLSQDKSDEQTASQENENTDSATMVQETEKPEKSVKNNKKENTNTLKKSKKEENQDADNLAEKLSSAVKELEEQSSEK